MKHDKNHVIKYLKSIADLNSFYVLTTKEIQPGLISYLADGQLWNLMEDDDELILSCISFLKENGNPIFENIEDADAHGNRLKAN